MSGTYQMVRQLVRQELQRVLNIVRRGVLGGGVGSSFTAKVQGAGDDGFEDVEVWQHYGFASRPPVSGEVLLVLPFGGGEGAIVCAETDRAHRPALAAGEVAVYGYKNGSVQGVAYFRSDGDIDLVPGTSQVVRIGGSSGCEFLLLGATTAGDIKTFADALAAITPGDAAANATALGAIKTAASLLSSDTSSWLCTAAKGK